MAARFLFEQIQGVKTVINVYVVSHKPVDIKKYNLDPCYKIIRVGKYARDNTVSEISDCTGDNISEKNPNYCELTAQYWIWKNDKESDIKGMCHYRRFFTKKRVSVSSDYFLQEKDMQQIFEKYDAIVPLYQNFWYGAQKKYLYCGYEKDLQTTKEAIKTLYPEYLPYYVSCFEESAGFRIGNMIIAKKEIFDEYSKWLFDVLEYVEKHTDLSKYTDQQARIYGYISERLMHVWLSANNNIKCKSMRFVNTDEKHTVLYYIKEILKIGGIYDFIKGCIFSVCKKTGIL